MKTFNQYLEFALARPEFQELMAQAEQALQQGHPDQAWEIANKAEPTNEDENSYKTHFLANLSTQAPAFLQDQKQKMRQPLPRSSRF